MENALVFVSIVLGVAVAFELEHLNRLLRSRKVRWHWAQPLFALFVLMTIMSFWWMVASNKSGGDISLARFLPFMWVLVLLNLLAAVALPDEIPDDGIDLAQYYQDNRRYMWALYFLMIAPLAGNWVLVGIRRSREWMDILPYLGSEIVPLSLVTLLFFARRWWLVAVGFAGLSLVVAAWLSRTL